MQWLAELSSGEDTVRDKLAQLPSGFVRHDIIALWNDILTDGELVRNGQLPGMEKAESEMIFNALLDGLVERGAIAQENGNELETAAVTTIFTQLISALQCDGVLRDYAIQRGLILAADSLPANTQGRGEIINTALAQITPDNINEFHVGTALNTFLSFKSQWSYAERKQIRDTINRLVLDLPNETKESFIQATDTPSMQVRVPLLTAIGASNQMHDQIKTWAASDNPLRFAASNAIRSTEIYPQQFDF